MQDAPVSLPTATRLFHWIIALLFIGMLAFGLYIENLPRGPGKGQMIGIHGSVGFVVLVLAVLRIFWRLKEGFPTPLSGKNNLQHRVAVGAHFLLLVGTIMMPVSGILGNVASGFGLSFFGIELIASQRGDPDFVPMETLSTITHIIHGLGGRLLIALILLHVAAALKHHLFDRDATLRRMMIGRVS